MSSLKSREYENIFKIVEAIVRLHLRIMCYPMLARNCFTEFNDMRNSYGYVKLH